MSRTARTSTAQAAEAGRGPGTASSPWHLPFSATIRRERTPARGGSLQRSHSAGTATNTRRQPWVKTLTHPETRRAPSRLQEWGDGSEPVEDKVPLSAPFSHPEVFRDLTNVLRCGAAGQASFVGVFTAKH